MNGRELKFNPGYEYLYDIDIYALQMCLDKCWSGKLQEERDAAKKEFPAMLGQVVLQCEGNLNLNIPRSSAAG